MIWPVSWIWKLVAAVGAILAAAMGVFLRDKRVIKQAENEKELESRRKLDKVETRVGELTDEQVREELRKWEKH